MRSVMISAESEHIFNNDIASMYLAKNLSRSIKIWKKETLPGVKTNAVPIMIVQFRTHDKIT